MSIRRLSHALLAALGVAMLALAAGCPAPKLPTGPPPEYEEPPAPTWFEAGAPAALDASVE